MSAAQPGPWSVRPYRLFSGEEIVGSVVDANGKTIRLTGVSLSIGSGIDTECEANARLISAAPELLTIAQKLDAAARQSRNALECSMLVDAFIEDARAALSKALGLEGDQR